MSQQLRTIWKVDYNIMEGLFVSGKVNFIESIVCMYKTNEESPSVHQN